MTSTSPPVPVAIRLEDDAVLRGHEWSTNGPAVVFVHDIGVDLDAWGRITGQVAAKGFRVISVDLPGHGLSDGDVDAGALAGQIDLMVKEIRGSFGPVALVAYGAVAELLLGHDESTGAPIQVMISPSPLNPAGIDWSVTTSATRLILSGTLNETAHGHVEAIYPKIRGQRLLITGASTKVGPELLVDQPQLLEHLTVFVRRYLVGHHLHWISEHADQVRALGDRQEDATDDE